MGDTIPETEAEPADLTPEGPGPEALVGRAAGVFSEDVLEHFFRNEQVYILCNINRVLAADGVARTLMPSLSKHAITGRPPNRCS